MAPQFFKFGKEPAPVNMHVNAELEVEEFGKFSLGPVTTVGRSPDSDVVLNARSVSRNHARIFYEGGHYWIKDLDSANGTRVNGKRVTLQMLAGQDQVCFGEIRGIFHTAQPASGPAPIARDPLAGSDFVASDGTPTGGLSGHYQPCEGRETIRDTVAAHSATSPPTEIQSLTHKVDSLKTENEALRREIARLRAAARTPGAASIPSDSDEVGRLRALVARLERALADSNLRLRHMKQRLDEKN